MKKHNLLRNAVHFALTAGVATSFGATAFAADEDVAEQDKITVTGSRIQRVDIEGPAPVTVISREDIDASGDISVAEVLRGSTMNSFGSFKPSSGSSAQSQAVVSLRGLGAGRTLVLLDGRRIASAPAFSGFGQNLNTLPLAAVDRIEILRDSASAVYGSDAIGGVINVILRKDFEGLNVRAGVGRPTRDGGDEATGSLVGGISSARGSLLFTLEHDEQGMIFNGQRDFSKIGVSSFGFLGSYFAYSGANSLGTYPDARCPSNRSSPAFDGSSFQDSTVIGTRCRFNYARTSANEASIRKDSLFINGSFEVSDDVNFFARATTSKTYSFGRYAPTPVVGATPFLPTMAASNPNNPSIGQQVDTDGDGAADFTGPFDLSLFYRNVPGGFRDSLVDDIFIDVAAGFQGSVDWFGGADWEIAAQHSRATTASTDFGFVNSLALQSIIDDGSYDIFNVRGDIPAGVNPATDDCGAPCDDFKALAQSVRVDGFTDNEYTYKGFDGQISFDVFQMENGPVPLVLGFDYADEFYYQDYDAVQNAGTVAGSAGGNDTIGSRSRYAVFAETQVQLHEMFGLNAALRYDSYGLGIGTSVVPKIGFEFRPNDTLLVRGGYGEGFRAPTLNNLFSTGGQSFNNAVDTLRCRTQSTGIPNDPNVPPGDPCNSTQYQNIFGGNINLKPEESENWGVGFVWNPTADFSTSVDYYDIEFTKEITSIPLQQILINEANGVGPGGTDNVTRNQAGNIVLVNASLTNLSGRKQDGIDVNAQYRFSLGENWGDFTARVDASKVLNYEIEVNPGSGFVESLAGAFTPDFRANALLGWTGGDFGASAIYEHITDTNTVGAGAGLGSWNVWHVQFTYDTPWNGKVTVGARNVFDQDPPLNTAVLDHPYYSNGLHDIYGRVPYIRYEQDL